MHADRLVGKGGHSFYWDGWWKGWEVMVVVVGGGGGGWRNLTARLNICLIQNSGGAFFESLSFFSSELVIASYWGVLGCPL